MRRKIKDGETIVVNGITQFGKTTYTARTLSDNQDAQKVFARTATKLNWYVRIADGSGVHTPPYEITFADSTVLGESSIEMPRGGASKFLHVQSFANGADCKYTITVNGIVDIFDPDIQVDNSPDGQLDDEKIKILLNSPPTFQVTWDPQKQDNPITACRGDNVVPFPIPANFLQTIAFQVAGLSDFGVVFTTPHAWASPFDSVDPTVVPKPGDSNTGPVIVMDTSDLGEIFTFHFERAFGAPSPEATIQLVNPGA
jgi:hypothetical protein